MRVAIPTWEGRVSPVFDVARRLVLVDFESGQEVARKEESIDETALAARTRHLAGLGVDVLLCGAISGPLAGMLRANGTKVVPWICGCVEDVLRAFVSGEPLANLFLMPGCGGGRGPGRRGRGRGRRGRGWDS